MQINGAALNFMKAGIITQPLANNLGGIIQNYALQETLRRLGHQPVTINVTPQCKHLTARMLAAPVVRWLRILPFIPSGNRLRMFRFATTRQRANLAAFTKSHINTTVPLQQPHVPDDAGAIICGSDQIWRPKYNVPIENMFLKFTGHANILRIAYAASFGVDHWEFSDEQTMECAGLLEKFNSVSVRERSGVELCRRHFGCQAQWVVDPTMLLEAKDYAPLCTANENRFRHKAGSYLLDPDKHSLKILKQVSHRLKLKVRDCNPLSASVEEWLAMFRDAEFIVTDSFHGTVFAIIFRKPFVTIANPDRGNARFKSLLEPLGLQNRMTVDSAKAIDIAGRPIDWAAVESLLNSLRSKSTEFLINAL